MPEGIPKNILSPYIERNTLCGDWRCITINSDSKSIIGEFCADTSRICIAYLEDALKYSPDFLEEYSIHCRTIIKNFHGTIRAFVLEKDSSYSLIIKAKGNVNFITKQVE